MKIYNISQKLELEESESLKKRSVHLAKGDSGFIVFSTFGIILITIYLV